MYFSGAGYAARLYCILRDRWKNLRDRFGPSIRLKKTLSTKRLRPCANLYYGRGYTSKLAVMLRSDNAVMSVSFNDDAFSR